MDFVIHSIRAFKDNYIWALIDAKKKVLWVVDPGDAHPVIDFATQNQLQLMGVLITHHHYDHCDGLSSLKEKYHMRVYGPAHPAIPATHVVEEGEEIYLADFNITLRVLSIPGHTLEHVAYYCSHRFVFCGDTLFSAGCGRVYEGTYAQMYYSLQRLSQLPDATQVYCTHEYTLANLMFAKTIEPDNHEIEAHIKYVKKCLGNDNLSLPSSIFLEKKINPFLRSGLRSIMDHLQSKLDREIKDPVQSFAELRKLKDGFSA